MELYYEACYPHVAEFEDQLSFAESERLTVLSKQNEQEGWWLAKTEQGQAGLIPYNFLQLVYSQAVVSPEDNSIMLPSGAKSTMDGVMYPDGSRELLNGMIQDRDGTVFPPRTANMDGVQLDGTVTLAGGSIKLPSGSVISADGSSIHLPDGDIISPVWLIDHRPQIAAVIMDPEHAKYFYEVLFDFVTEEAKQLPVRQGEHIEIRFKNTGEAGWWEACNNEGRTGLVPNNYIQLMYEGGVRSEEDDSMILPSGVLSTVSGLQYPDGCVEQPDGSIILVPGGQVVRPAINTNTGTGLMISVPPGCLYIPDGTFKHFNGAIEYPSGAKTQTNGMLQTVPAALREPREFAPLWPLPSSALPQPDPSGSNPANNPFSSHPSDMSSGAAALPSGMNSGTGGNNAGGPPSPDIRPVFHLDYSQEFPADPDDVYNSQPLSYNNNNSSENNNNSQLVNSGSESSKPIALTVSDHSSSNSNFNNNSSDGRIHIAHSDEDEAFASSLKPQQQQQEQQQHWRPALPISGPPPASPLSPLSQNGVHTRAASYSPIASPGRSDKNGGDFNDTVIFTQAQGAAVVANMMNSPPPRRNQRQDQQQSNQFLQPQLQQPNQYPPPQLQPSQYSPQLQPQQAPALPPFPMQQQQQQPQYPPPQPQQPQYPPPQPQQPQYPPFNSNQNPHADYSDKGPPPALNFSIFYDSNKLHIKIVEAAGAAPPNDSYYVELCLAPDPSRKTVLRTRLQPGPNPVWNQSYAYTVAEKKLQSRRLELALMRNTLGREVVGRLFVGPDQFASYNTPSFHPVALDPNNAGEYASGFGALSTNAMQTQPHPHQMPNTNFPGRPYPPPSPQPATAHFPSHPPAVPAFPASPQIRQPQTQAQSNQSGPGASLLSRYHYRALADWVPPSQGAMFPQLTLVKGQKLQLVNKRSQQGEGWWEAADEMGRRGVVPCTYLQLACDGCPEQLLPTGTGFSITLPSGAISTPEGVMHPDGSKCLNKDGDLVTLADGNRVQLPAVASLPSGFTLLPDATILRPDGLFQLPSGSISPASPYSMPTSEGGAQRAPRTAPKLPEPPKSATGAANDLPSPSGQLREVLDRETTVRIDDSVLYTPKLQPKAYYLEVLHDYQARDKKELTVTAGDTLSLVHTAAGILGNREGWWEAILTSDGEAVVGNVPATFVQLKYDGALLMSDGSVQLPSGARSRVDGTVDYPDGSKREVDGKIQLPNGLQYKRTDMTIPRKAVMLPDGTWFLSNGGIKLPCGGMLMTNGMLREPDGSLQRARWGIALSYQEGEGGSAAGAEMGQLPAGTVQLADGNLQFPDGSVHSAVAVSLGVLKLGVVYQQAEEKNKLLVKVFECWGLPAVANNVHVSLQLLPDEKGKTVLTTKSLPSINPVFNQSFSYALPLQKLRLKMLEVCVLLTHPPEVPGGKGKDEVLGKVFLQMNNVQVDGAHEESVHWHVLGAQGPRVHSEAELTETRVSRHGAAANQRDRGDSVDDLDPFKKKIRPSNRELERSVDRGREREREPSRIGGTHTPSDRSLSRDGSRFDEDGSGDLSQPVNASSSRAGGHFRQRSDLPTALPGRLAMLAAKKNKIVPNFYYWIASFGWDSQNAGQLSFTEGETFTVLKKQTTMSGWWEVRDSSGRIGLAPFNRLQLRYRYGGGGSRNSRNNSRDSRRDSTSTNGEDMNDEHELDDGSFELPTGCISTEDGIIKYPDGSYSTTDGSVIVPLSDSAASSAQARVVIIPARHPQGEMLADGAVQLSDLSILYPSGAKLTPQGLLAMPDGSKFEANWSTGTLQRPSASANAKRATSSSSLSSADDIESAEGELHKMARAGNTNEVLQLLQSGACPNSRDKLANSPLHCTSSIQTAQALVSHGARIDLKNVVEKTAAHNFSGSAREALAEAAKAYLALPAAIADSECQQTWLVAKDPVPTECELCSAELDSKSRKKERRCQRCGRYTCAPCRKRRAQTMGLSSTSSFRNVSSSPLPSPRDKRSSKNNGQEIFKICDSCFNVLNRPSALKPKLGVAAGKGKAGNSVDIDSNPVGGDEDNPVGVIEVEVGCSGLLDESQAINAMAAVFKRAQYVAQTETIQNYPDRLHQLTARELGSNSRRGSRDSQNEDDNRFVMFSRKLHFPFWRGNQEHFKFSVYNVHGMGQGRSGKLGPQDVLGSVVLQLDGLLDRHPHHFALTKDNRECGRISINCRMLDTENAANDDLITKVFRRHKVARARRRSHVKDGATTMRITVKCTHLKGKAVRAGEPHVLVFERDSQHKYNHIPSITWADRQLDPKADFEKEFLLSNSPPSAETKIRNRTLRFEVYDIKRLSSRENEGHDQLKEWVTLGSVTVSLFDIIEEPSKEYGYELTYEGRRMGWVSFRCTLFGIVQCDLACRSLPKLDIFSRCDPIVGAFDRDGSYICQTESAQGTQNPEFEKKPRFRLQDDNRWIRLSVFNVDPTHGSQVRTKDLIGSTLVNLRHILQCPDRYFSYRLGRPAQFLEKGKKTGKSVDPHPELAEALTLRHTTLEVSAQFISIPPLVVKPTPAAMNGTVKATTVGAPPPTPFRGFLIKRSNAGGSINTWKKKKCLLQASVLRWVKEDAVVDDSETLDNTNRSWKFVQVAMGKVSLVPVGDFDRENVFLLRTQNESSSGGKKMIYFQASDHMQRDQWLLALNRHGALLEVVLSSNGKEMLDCAYEKAHMFQEKRRGSIPKNPKRL